MVKKVGGSMQLFHTMEKYDFVAIEVPKDEGIMAINLYLGSMENIRTKH